MFPQIDPCLAFFILRDNNLLLTIDQPGLPHCSFPSILYPKKTTLDCTNKEVKLWAL